MKELVQGPHDVCHMLGTHTLWAAVFAVARGTASRANMRFDLDGVSLCASVPNSDFKTARYKLYYPFLETAFSRRLQAVEDECEALYEWSLGGGDNPPVENYGLERETN